MGELLWMLLSRSCGCVISGELCLLCPNGPAVCRTTPRRSAGSSHMRMAALLSSTVGGALFAASSEDGSAAPSPQRQRQPPQLHNWEQPQDVHNTPEQQQQPPLRLPQSKLPPLNDGRGWRRKSGSESEKSDEGAGTCCAAATRDELPPPWTSSPRCLPGTSTLTDDIGADVVASATVHAEAQGGAGD
jgi:hypothetical protein